MMDSVLDQLFQLTPNLSPKLQKAARTVLDNPGMVAVSSMRSMAQRAGVAPPTMLRLAQQLGFDSWDEMKILFQQALTRDGYSDKARGLKALAHSRGESGLFAELSDSAHRNIDSIYHDDHYKAVSAAADIVLSAPRTYVIGAGSAHWMAAYLQYATSIAIPTLVAPRANGNDITEGLIRIESTDCLIAISSNPYARKTVEAMTFATEKGAKLVYITDSLAAPMAAKADVLITGSTDSPMYFPSMVSVVASIEALMAVIVSHSRKETIDAIAEQDALRSKFRVYV